MVIDCRPFLLALLVAANAVVGAAPAQDRPPRPMALPAESQDAEALAQADPAGVDVDAVTGAVMSEKDMLQYCVNIADGARETRYALIERSLEEKQAQIDEKLAALTEKMEAIREYVEIRERFRSAAEKHVVSIFETMRPDAAASQIAELETGLAASIIMRLDPKVSSRIMTEMAPRQAAQIANYLTVAMRHPEPRQVGQ